MILITTQKITIAEAMKYGAANRGAYEEAAATLIKQPSFAVREAAAVPFIRKFYVSEKSESGGKLAAGQVRHWITTDSIDRDAEIVRPRGLDLKTYRQNPVVFWGHNYSEPANIIGSNVDLAVEDHGIRALTQFRMREQKAADIFNCYADETLRAWSIGFIPIKGHAAKPMEGGIDKPDYGPDQIVISLGPSDPTVARWVHDKAILLEYSAVPLPSNPDALTEAVGKGLIDLSDELMRDFELNLEAIHRKRVEAGVVARKVAYFDFSKEAHKEHEEEAKQDGGTAEAEAPAQGGGEAERRDGGEAVVSKGVIGYHDYGNADPDTSWDGPEAMKAEPETLKKICAWYDATAPDVKSSYKLPHHDPKSLKAVLRGVNNAKARLSNTDIPDGDKAGVEAHLNHHQSDFEKADSGKGVGDIVVNVSPTAEMKAMLDAKMKELMAAIVKEGRVLSDKNRKLISTVLTTMEDAAAAMKKAYQPLKELLDATDPGASGDGEGDGGNKPPAKPKPADDGSGQVGEDGKPVGDGGKKPDAGASGKGIMIAAFPDPEESVKMAVVALAGSADMTREFEAQAASVGLAIKPDPLIGGNLDQENVTPVPKGGPITISVPAPRKGIFDGAIDKVLGRV
jgi:hypothetical protein